MKIRRWGRLRTHGGHGRCVSQPSGVDDSTHRKISYTPGDEEGWEPTVVMPSVYHILQVWITESQYTQKSPVTHQEMRKAGNHWWSCPVCFISSGVDQPVIYQTKPVVRILEKHDYLLNSSLFSHCGQINTWQEQKWGKRGLFGLMQFEGPDSTMARRYGTKGWWRKQLMSAAARLWDSLLICQIRSQIHTGNKASYKPEGQPLRPASSSEVPPPEGSTNSQNISIHQRPSVQTHAPMRDISHPSLQHGFPEGNQDPSTGSLAPHLCAQTPYSGD